MRYSTIFPTLHTCTFKTKLSAAEHFIQKKYHYNYNYNTERYKYNIRITFARNKIATSTNQSRCAGKHI